MDNYGSPCNENFIIITIVVISRIMMVDLNVVSSRLVQGGDTTVALDQEGIFCRFLSILDYHSVVEHSPTRAPVDDPGDHALVDVVEVKVERGSAPHNLRLACRVWIVLKVLEVDL